MTVGVLDHYNVSTRKLEETVNFYENVLGFTNGPQPASLPIALPCKRLSWLGMRCPQRRTCGRGSRLWAGRSTRLIRSIGFTTD
jgi:hypothetical protein